MNKEKNHYLSEQILSLAKETFFKTEGKRFPEDRGERTVIGFVFPQQPKPNYRAVAAFIAKRT